MSVDMLARRFAAHEVVDRMLSHVANEFFFGDLHHCLGIHPVSFARDQRWLGSAQRGHHLIDQLGRGLELGAVLDVLVFCPIN